MAKKYAKYIDQLIDALAEEGQTAINIAYRHRDFTNRLYNLHDSYGSAVYYNGRLVKRSIRYLGPEKRIRSIEGTGWQWTKARSMPDFRGTRYLPGDQIDMSGREEVMDFFSQYTPPAKGMQLVVVAAMWYASVLESGGGNLKRKWRVISTAMTKMQEIAQKVGGKVSQIQTGRVLSQPPTIKDSSWS